MAEDMTESVGRLSMAVLLMHAAHATEVSHEMLQGAAVMRRQTTDQRTQSWLALLHDVDFFTPPHTYQCFSHGNSLAML